MYSNIPLTALFTKPPASRFPALPGTIPPFHHSTIPSVKPSMGERPLGVVPAAGMPVTKELAAL